MINNPFTYNQQNPYLGQMANTITSQINDNLTRNVMPQIASGAQQVGGFGGSRQGVVEANALNSANKQAADALTGMYYGDYNNAMSRQLQKYGQDQSYNLGMAQNTTNRRGQDLNYNLGRQQVGATTRGQDLNYNLGQQQNLTSQRGQDLNYGATTRGQDLNYDLGNLQNNTTMRGQDYNLASNILQNQTTNRGQDLNYNLGMTNAGNTAQGQMMNFYTGNRQLDQSGMRLGMDMFNTGNAGTLAQGQGIYNLGFTSQQAPWQAYQNFGNVAQPYTGFGSTTGSTSGSPAAGFLGGALGASQLYNIFK